MARLAHYEMAALLAQEKFHQPIQMMLGLPPITSMGVDQLPEVGTMIIVLEMREFVYQYIIDASTGGFD